MEFLYVSEVKLATHKVDNTYVQVVLKEDHDTEIAELKERLHLQDIEFQNGVLVTNEEYDSMWKKGFHGLELEIAEHKKNMVWALKMLYDQEKGNPVYEEMCSKYFCKGKELDRYDEEVEEILHA